MLIEFLGKQQAFVRSKKIRESFVKLHYSSDTTLGNVEKVHKAYLGAFKRLFIADLFILLAD
jgi:hypothetical protein